MFWSSSCLTRWVASRSGFAVFLASWSLLTGIAEVALPVFWALPLDALVLMVLVK